ncbi:MAG: hypothetical protein KZQ73_12850 [Candidatus Thiodiazotropha sp. (ex Semelilucina semeliformis)]|nr:hypothetical protein [Candidatus Thiodiazotropha sp. (ex Semelilucina semeliformis)]
MNDNGLYDDFRNSLLLLLQVIDKINGMDFDVYNNRRTRLLVRSLKTLENNNPDDIVPVSDEIMKTIYRWYDGGFKNHSKDEVEKQDVAIANVYKAATQYLAKYGDEHQRQKANDYLKQL